MVHAGTNHLIRSAKIQMTRRPTPMRLGKGTPKVGLGKVRLVKFGASKNGQFSDLDFVLGPRPEWWPSQ